jgi:hypothetical protein
MLAGMGLAGIEEDRADAPVAESFVEIIERWRRQRAVGSGQGAELDQKIVFLPEVAQRDHRLVVE